MSQEINYKKKYLELRGKYINDLDMAFRLGVEQGMQQAQQQQAIDAKAEAQEMQMQQKQIEAQGMAAQNTPEGESAPTNPEQPGEGPKPPGMPDQTEQQGSELDQHIGKLEGLLGSSSEPEIQKSLQALMSLRKAQRDALDMKKAESAIQGIAKALHKPAFKFGVQAAANLTDNAKKSVTLQHKIVNDVMKAWADEDSKASKDIKNILDIESITGK
jgi:DNA polymerase III gamma/tau subunit